MAGEETLLEDAPGAADGQAILDAEHVYLLMEDEYRISRNARAQWFFSHLNGSIEVGRQRNTENRGDEIFVLSVVPVDPPSSWNCQSAADYKYRVLPNTALTFLAQRYKLVFCLDLSPSVMTVDAHFGEVMLDRMLLSLKRCLEAITEKFSVWPDGDTDFSPQLYVTVVAYTSSFILPNQLVLAQGWLLTSENVHSFWEVIINKLNAVEDCLEKSATARVTKTNGNRHLVGLRQPSLDRHSAYSCDFDFGGGYNGDQRQLSVSYSDTSFVDLLRYGILALQLLPDNSSAGIIVVTDGIIGVQDISIFQSLLSQLRNSAISCSFLNVSGTENPGCCWGYPSSTIMQFIALATYGAYIPQSGCNLDELKSCLEMNLYHRAFMCWSFQWHPYLLKTNIIEDINYRLGSNSFNHSFMPIHDNRVERKIHIEKSINTSLSTLIFCRLREGYCIRNVSFQDSDHIEVTLFLPWKEDVGIIYAATSSWPLEGTSCRYKVIIEGSYEFLHDWTCTTKRPIKSMFRCNVVKKFYETLQSLSQTDAILSHLHSFAANPAYYTIPDSVRNGVPLFYLAPGSSHPVVCSGDMPCTKFPEFWQPICILDINIWQKWMHTHRIGILLTHDLPLPKHLHLPNSSDRYHTIQCRQGLTALNTLLADWSSFVLVENHSYINFMFAEADKPPISFYVIRVTFKAPCMVIRLAFLGGTPSQERLKIVAQLRDKILGISCHHRPIMKEPIGSRKNGRDRHPAYALGSRGAVDGNPLQDTRCCKQLMKPVEKILIRYERTPIDYANRMQQVVPSHRFAPPNLMQRKTVSMLSTLGCYLHHQRWVWMAQGSRASPTTMKSLERVLGTLVKIRLENGFYFAHSNSGMINMVLEVAMKVPSSAKSPNGESSASGEGETCPCVVQYIMFPPHSTAENKDSFSEEDRDSEAGEAAELDGELQIITECWVEPQHGNVAATGESASYLNGLSYRELPQAIFSLDYCCVSTLLTFDHLNLMCRNKKIVTPDLSPGIRRLGQLPPSAQAVSNPGTCSIHLVPFPFDLMKLLPKCQQAELVFSTLAQEFVFPEVEIAPFGDGDPSNALLLKLLHSRMVAVHDREVRLSEEEQQAFQLLVQHRRPGQPCGLNVPKSAECEPVLSMATGSGEQLGISSARPSKVADDQLVHWRCYLKGISETHFLIAFVPASHEDVLLFDSPYDQEEAESQDLTEDGEDCGPEMGGVQSAIPSRRNRTMTIFAYDCSLSALVDQTIGEQNASPYCDIYKDYRTPVEMGEETATIRSSEGSKYTSPEPGVEENEASSSNRACWIRHLNLVAVTFCNCFVSAIYRSLQRRAMVDYHDVRYAMEDVCVETVQEIDITKFLQTVCSLSKVWQPVCQTTNAEKANLNDNSNALHKSGVLQCCTSKKVQDLIHAKFGAIMRRSFIPVASNPDYFCYSPCRLNRMKSKSRGTEDWSDSEDVEDDRGTVEFTADDEKLATPNTNNYFVPGMATNLSRENSSANSSLSEDACADVEGDREDFAPLFVHLICSVHSQKDVYNFPVQTIPTCFETIAVGSSLPNDPPVDPNSLRITLDVMCLTLPPEVENTKPEDVHLRSTSFCSSSPVPQDSVLDSKDSDGFHMLDDLEVDPPKDFLAYLPEIQQHAVSKCVDEIKWMLLDELASFARLIPVTEDVLLRVTEHVLGSVGRPGCSVHRIPLRFVFGAEQSLDKFVHEFGRMSIPGYRLIREGGYYYLAVARYPASGLSSAALSSGLASKHLIVQSHPHRDDAADLGPYPEFTGDGRQRSASSSTKFGSSADPPPSSMGDATSVDPASHSCQSERSENEGRPAVDRLGRQSNSESTTTTSEGVIARRFSGAGERVAKRSSTRSSSFQRSQNRCADEVPSTAGFGMDAVNDCLVPSKDYDGGSSSTEDEARVALRKAATTGGDSEMGGHALYRGVVYGKRRKRSLNLGVSGIAPSFVRHELEDGYDGDSSDVENDQDLCTELEVRSHQLPNFWLIFRITPETMDVISQYRDAELDDDQLKLHADIIHQCISYIKNSCKLVNQALLLQELHDTHFANQLLEPEADEDIWRSEERSIGDAAKHFSVHSKYTYEDQEQFVECQNNYLEANMKLMPGVYSCPVVWETQFVLHPRLKTGIGRSASKGVQAMKSVLSRLSVNNRKNMFVYKERNGGAVFYLRLHENCLPGLHSLADATSMTRPSVTDDGTSLIGSRSSSLQSLNSLGQEPRSRVNSMPEKDRDHCQDSISLSSRLSIGRFRAAEDAITLSVYGITEAGPDIKEDLVKALQSRLDDAVLELISITLARNPMCKLTPEDVQFIQRPGEPPERLVHFAIRAQVLPFLQVIVYYLQQNLMQFLNIPKYNDGRPENHFRRFPSQQEQVTSGETCTRPWQETSSAFLFIRPQEASNKGIACIVLAVVDGQGNLVQYVDCPQPSPESYKDEILSCDFDSLTQTELHQPSVGTPSKSPGPVALIQFQIWAKGKVDIDRLVDQLQVGIGHALWDLVIEYRLLTAPFAEMPSTEDASGICSEPSTPLKCIPKMKQTLPLVSGDGLRAKDQASSPLFVMQAKLRELSSSVPDIVAKCRSPTGPSTRMELPFEIQPISPPPVTARGQGPGGKEEEVHLGIDAEVLRRQEKYELGEKGVLHSVYSRVASEWMEYGKSLGVCSVQKQILHLSARYSVELLLRDLQMVISSLMTDTTPKLFKKDDDFVPFPNHPVIREKAKLFSATSVDYSRSYNQQPLPGKSSTFIVAGRNVRQWRVSSGRLDKDDVAEIADNMEANMKLYKDYQRFPPLIHAGDCGDRVSVAGGISPQPLKRIGTSPFDVDGSPFLFIPRQRLALIIVQDYQIVLYTYNWAPEVTSMLMERAIKLVNECNARSCMLTSIVLQKLGLFVNQPSTRKSESQKSMGSDQKLGVGEVDALIKGNRTLHRREGGVFVPPYQRRNTSSHSSSNIPFVDVLRDSWPSRPMHLCSYAHCSDPVFQHGTQFQEIRISDRREKYNQIVTIFRERETRASMPVQFLRQVSRIEHYCFTPLLFHPLWRLQVASARDHSFPGIFPTPGKLQQPMVEPLPAPMNILGTRSRHSSASSLTSDPRRIRRPSAGAVPGTVAPLPIALLDRYALRNTESQEWHSSMGKMFIDEFIQYLQTLGFVLCSNVSGNGRPQQKRVPKSTPDLPPTSEEQFGSTLGSTKHFRPQYMHKVLVGGIILLELLVCEPYFGVKMYTLENIRLRALSGSRSCNTQYVMNFTDEFDKVKVTLHLHSFTYDYHLRSIVIYISGRQMPLRQGYHAVGFLDDFLKYYQKSPNFARNLVHEGEIAISPITTNASQLFEYLLKNDHLYDMRAIKMVSLDDQEEKECVLVQMSTQKVTYRDSSDTKQVDEFDVSLLVARDTPGSLGDPIDASCNLAVKYFIILTSCREIFPKPVVEKQPGTFRAVITVAVPPSRPPTPPGHRGSPEPLMDRELSSSTEVGCLTGRVGSTGTTNPRRTSLGSSNSTPVVTPAVERSLDSRVGDASSAEAADHGGSMGDGRMGESERSSSHEESSTRIAGIRQEVVNYMGYFSTHEELMHKIMMEQAQEANKNIQAILNSAMIDCRRDLLWKRLLKEGRDVDDGASQRRRNDLRDYSANLSYAEFSDLLKLVECKSLMEIDSRLGALAHMPINWYQTLVKVLLQKHGESNRHFTAPDGNTQYVAILDARLMNAFMLLSIDLHTNRAELGAVFREQCVARNPSLFTVIEDVVNACCFHLWSSML